MLWIYYTLIKRLTKEDNMRTLKLRAHIKAMSNTMEVIIIASVIALVSDFCWVCHDVIDNGMSISYAFIGGGLFLATVMTAYALRKHHHDAVENGIKTLLSEKIAEQKARNRTKRHLELVRSK